MKTFNEEIYNTLAKCHARITELESDLEELAEFVQPRHFIGEVKAIGLREAAVAAKQVIGSLELQALIHAKQVETLKAACEYVSDCSKLAMTQEQANTLGKRCRFALAEAFETKQMPQGG